MKASAAGSPRLQLGLRANLAQFSLLVAVNALVGGMLGQERTVLPLLAEGEFGLGAYTSALTFILAFGATKAATNYVAGTFSDRFGRKPVLIVGWLVALPVPLLLIWAPSWGWVVAANVLLGINQGLTWSTTVIMKIDLVGPAQRGLAMGLNEAAGYLAVAATALATGFIAARYGLRPEPFYLGIAYAALGLGLSALAVRETREHARLEARTHTARVDGRHDHLHAELTDRQVFVQTSFREPALSAASQAGMVNNLNDGLAWGLFPVLFAAAGLPVGQIGILVALYPAVWGLGQLVTGALSDRIGRKPLITGGMLLQAAALALVALGHSFALWALAAVPARRRHRAGLSDPPRRHRRRGTPRLAGPRGRGLPALARRRLRRRRPGSPALLADAFGITTAIWAVAALTAASGRSSPCGCTKPTHHGRQAPGARDDTSTVQLACACRCDGACRWSGGYRAARAEAHAGGPGHRPGLQRCRTGRRNHRRGAPGPGHARRNESRRPAERAVHHRLGRSSRQRRTHLPPCRPPCGAGTGLPRRRSGQSRRRPRRRVGQRPAAVCVPVRLRRRHSHQSAGPLRRSGPGPTGPPRPGRQHGARRHNSGRSRRPQPGHGHGRPRRRAWASPLWPARSSSPLPPTGPLALCCGCSCVPTRCSLPGPSQPPPAPQPRVPRAAPAPRPDLGRLHQRRQS